MGPRRRLGAEAGSEPLNWDGLSAQLAKVIALYRVNRYDWPFPWTAE